MTINPIIEARGVQMQRTTSEYSKFGTRREALHSQASGGVQMTVYIAITRTVFGLVSI
jgi:hypothetical protein